MKYQAVLILGPTGAGKSPLGELLEREGLSGRRCVHFDFGANLREIAAEGAISGRLNGSDLTVIRNSLETGALLKDEEFHIAEKTLLTFADKRNIEAQNLIVLNGLPRHAGQAEKIERLVMVETVVSLAGSDAAIFERIKQNTGGDRTGRIDDSRDMVARKLATYREKTAPLLDHYRQKGVRILEIRVDENTTAIQMYNALAAEKW